MKASDSTFKPVLMMMSGRLAAFAVTFFAAPLLARAFSQNDFGTYKQFLLLVYTFYLVGQAGFAECLFYFLPADPQGAGRYVFNSFVMLTVMGLLFSGGLVANSERVAEWLNNPRLAHYIWLAALYLVFMLMGTIFEITMICRKRYPLATASYAASDILRVAFLLVPALLTRNLEWAFIGAVAFCLLRVVTMLGFFRSEFGPDFRFDAGLLRRQAAYAAPFALYVGVHTLQTNYHHYAVSHYFDATMFAIYSVGCLQIPLVDFMATPAANVMMVRMGEHIREGRKDRLLGVWHDQTRKLALIFFPLVALLVVSAFPLITLLYTQAYAASAPIFMVWSLSIVFAAFQTDSVLRVFAQNRWLLITNVVRLAAVASLMSWFLYTFNLMGAVLVTLVGMTIAKVMSLARIKGLLGVDSLQLLPWRALGSILMAAMLAAVPSAFINARLDVPALVALPLIGVAYVITFGGLVWSLGLVTDSEKAALKRSLYVWNRRSAESRTETGV